MHLSGKIWSCLSYLANILTLSSVNQLNVQQPLGLGGHVRLANDADVSVGSGYPIFKPPTGRLYFEGSEFKYEYPKIPKYEFCGHETNNHPNSKLPTYNIETDYETMTPISITQKYEFTVKDGVYIAGRHTDERDGKKFPGYTGGAHPMHLHGHDFAILQQEYDATLTPETWNPNFKNPARRDVVLLPANGFVVIAFRIDNPGSWIMHCHIAFHASEGLALQIMENQQAANALWPANGKAVPEAKRVCKNWRNWQKDCTKHWPGFNKDYQCFPACNNATSTLACPNLFQDDSGI